MSIGVESRASRPDGPDPSRAYPRFLFRCFSRPNITLRATRRVAVRTVFAKSGRPASRVRVSAGRGSAGTSASGTTDADGRLMPRLPPGEYELVADPTESGAACIRTTSSLSVNEQPADQTLEVHALTVFPGWGTLRHKRESHA